MRSFWRDLFLGARLVLKKPGLVLIAVITLGLGIGANTAIFSALNAVLLRPLPYPDEDRLVVLQETRTDQPTDSRGVSYLNFVDWRDRSRSFESMAIVSTDEATLTGEGEPARVQGAIVSANLFQTLGVRPALGRSFTAEDESPGGVDGFSAVMLSDHSWRNRFGSDARIVGRKITLDEQAYTVIGVTAPGLLPLQKESIEYWTTTAANGDASKPGTANASRSYPAYFGAIARLRPGVSINQAKADLDAVIYGMQEQYPASNAKTGARLTPLRDLMIGNAGSYLWLLLGIVGAVLLIACVNVTNLLLARAAARRREIAIRAALGANTRRIIQEQLGEGLLLSSLGGALGLVLSMWLIDLMLLMAPPDIPRISGIAPDWRVLAFTLAGSLLTGVFCSVIPAIISTRINLVEAVKGGGRIGSVSPIGQKFRSALVVIQMAAALTLLVGAGLLVNSLIRLQRVQPGFETKNILTMQFVLSSDRYFDRRMKPERINLFLDELTARLKRMPGVREASYAQSAPLTSIENNTRFDIAERPSPKGEQATAQLRFIGLGYFRTLGVRTLKGRDFNERDNPQSPPVVIINEAFAKEHFNGEESIGKKLLLGWGGDEPKEIVGVIGNVRHRSLADAERPEMYVPQAQFANAGITLLVQTDVKPESLAAPIKQEIHRLDPELPITEIKTLEQYRNDSLALPRFNTLLLGLFAGLATILTVIGLYSVISYSASQRTSEIGIRLALGAQSREILALVIAAGMRFAILGVGLGLAVSWLLTRLMKSLLYGVDAADPLTFFIVSMILLGVALLACWRPARRASKVDPIIALRHD
jgi:putative ABC transport system permease protein